MSISRIFFESFVSKLPACQIIYHGIILEIGLENNKSIANKINILT